MNIIPDTVACILNGSELEFSLGKENSRIYWIRWLVASTDCVDAVRESVYICQKLIYRFPVNSLVSIITEPLRLVM